jgi:uncharacterized membrane protein YhhN
MVGMTGLFSLFSTLTGLAVVALLVAEYRDSRAGVWVAKPLASAGFIAAALAGGAADHEYGRAILLGLALSMLGDVLLIPREREAVFRLGVLSFLSAHLVYAYGFLGLGMSRLPTIVAAVVFCAVGLPVGRWLSGYIPPALSAAAYAYMVVITAMVVCAAGAAAAHGFPAVFIGAFAFYLSDLSVALDRFLGASFVHRLWGLPLYFGAQLVLAWTAAV